MSASFYASPTIGATTTVAVFFHEIPHEVGDFALLVQSGFSKRAAMASQFVTALGALLGTLIGIAVQEYGGGAKDGGAMPRNGGLWGTSLVSSPKKRCASCRRQGWQPFRSVRFANERLPGRGRIDLGGHATAIYGGDVSVRRDRGGDSRVAGDGPEEDGGAEEDVGAVCRGCGGRGHDALYLVA